MSHPQAIFFDLDGTLIDTAPDMGGALNRMLEKRQRPVVPAAVYRSSVSHGSIALLKLGFPELGAEEIKVLLTNLWGKKEVKREILKKTHGGAQV